MDSSIFDTKFRSRLQALSTTNLSDAMDSVGIAGAVIGVRPMFGENRANLETFLFDFKGDLYGTTLSVALVDFLRPEEKFDSLDALIAQMDADCARAREILSAS